MTEFTTETFDQLVVQNQEKPVLVDFWAVWCVPCQMLHPVLAVIEADLGDKAVFGKVNIEEQPQLTEKYNVMSIPTVMLFWKGQVVKQFIGLQDKETYVAAINEVLSGKLG